MSGAALSGSGRRPALWLTFVAVHGWLTYLGVVVAPSTSFYDVDLYRYWMFQALDQGSWPVLDQPWVYPAAAVLPMLVPALVSTWSTTAYALAWCAMVAVLDALAVVVLLRRGPRARPTPAAVGVADDRGVWWWLAFLVLLGPVAIGRLDAVVAPLLVIALVLAVGSERGVRLAAGLLTLGAWIKVAPGALLLPLATASRRPLRQVVLPAAAVCGVVVLAVAAGGGASRLLGFLDTQGTRGLQVEATGATPWMLASLVREDVSIQLNEGLITYEVQGPGAAGASAVLGLLLPLLVAVVAAVLLVARRRDRGPEALLPGALTLLAVLIVANKVGSPQFLTWLAAPITVALTLRPPGRGDDRPALGSTAEPGRTLRMPSPWTVGAALLTLLAAGLTQLVFPWGYMGLLTGDVPVSVALALRNVTLLGILVCAAAWLVGAVRAPADAPGPTTPEPVTRRAERPPGR